MPCTSSEPIGSWNVAKVDDMSYLFRNATVFNQPINQWCVSLIKGEPLYFAWNSALAAANKPVWGTCPIPSQYTNNFAISCALAENTVTLVHYRKSMSEVVWCTGITFKVNGVSKIWMFEDNTAPLDTFLNTEFAGLLGVLNYDLYAYKHQMVNLSNANLTLEVTAYPPNQNSTTLTFLNNSSAGNFNDVHAGVCLSVSSSGV